MTEASGAETIVEWVNRRKFAGILAMEKKCKFLLGIWKTVRQSTSLVIKV